MKKFINNAVQIVFTILMTTILLAFATEVGNMVSQGLVGKIITIGLLTPCVLMVIFGSTVLNFIRSKIIKPLDKLSTQQMIIIIAVVTFLTKLFFIFLLDVDSTLHSDMQKYHSFANQIAANGKITEDTLYATAHTYTAIYGMILSPFAKIFGSDPKALTSVLTAAMSIVSVLLFDILRKHTGKSIAFCGILLYNLLPMGMFQTQLLVHETALLFFSTLALWLLLKALDKSRHASIKIICTILSGICMATGFSINAAGKAIFASLCIFAFVNIIKDKFSVKKFVQLVCFLLIFTISASCMAGLLSTSVNSLIKAESNQVFVSDKRVPYGCGIYFGFNYDSRGLINKEDADTYQAYQGIDDPEEAKNYQVELIRGRLSEYVQNPIKIPLLFFRKLQVIWGIWMPFPYAQGNAIEHFILAEVGGILYKGMYMLSAQMFLLVVSMILFSTKRKNENYESIASPGLHFKMVIISISLTLLLFEVAQKYGSHLHILVYAIWMLQLKDFLSFSSQAQSKLKCMLKKHPA